jgi:hypothetical protein
MVNSTTENYEACLKIKTESEKYIKELAKSLSVLVNPLVHRREDESQYEFDVRRVGAYQFHTKWADKNKNNEYFPIMDEFVDIYNNFHKIPERFVNNTDVINEPDESTDGNIFLDKNILDEQSSDEELIESDHENKKEDDSNEAIIGMIK